MCMSFSRMLCSAVTALLFSTAVQHALKQVPDLQTNAQCIAMTCYALALSATSQTRTHIDTVQSETFIYMEIEIIVYLHASLSLVQQHRAVCFLKCLSPTERLYTPLNSLRYGVTVTRPHFDIYPHGYLKQ
jgi:hypothetical protein